VTNLDGLPARIYDGTMAHSNGSSDPIPCPEGVETLARRFVEPVEAYRGPAYNETHVRRESIDPFFKALGWGVDNEAGHAEAYKDVIHEDAINVGGNPTAIQRHVDATDRQIDQLVYELHGLTEDDIRIVEEATQR